MPEETMEIRLCHLIKWPDFNGYGFNLHAEKGKAGQFIGKVDENSPAELAKLQPGDRIVEVDGVNIGNENHKQVVKRIQAGGDQTKLLVLNDEEENYFKERKIVVTGDLPNVRCHTTPIPRPNPDAPPAEEEKPVNGEVPKESEPEVEATTAAVAAVAVTEVATEQSPSAEALDDPDGRHKQTVTFQEEVTILPDAPPAEQEEITHEQDFPEPPPPEPEETAHDDVDLPAPEPLPVEHEVVVEETILSTTPAAPPLEQTPEPVEEVHSQPVKDEDDDDDHTYEEADPTIVAIPPPEPVAEPEPEPPKEPEPEPPKEPEPEPPKEPEPVPEPEPVKAPEPEPVPVPTPVVAEPVQSTPPVQSNGTEGGLNLNLSAAEMRERLSSKKKQDPRLKGGSFQHKYEVFQRM